MAWRLIQHSYKFHLTWVVQRWLAVPTDDVITLTYVPTEGLECVALLRHISWEPGSCVGPETGCPDFYSFPQALQAILGALGPTSVGRDSSVGIATRYGLDGPGIESRRGRDFPHPSRPALGHTQLPIQWVPGVKRPGRGVDHPLPSSAEVKYRAELYVYSPSGPSWPVMGWTLPSPLPLPRAYLKRDNDGFLLHPFKFIIH